MLDMTLRLALPAELPVPFRLWESCAAEVSQCLSRWR